LAQLLLTVGGQIAGFAIGGPVGAAVGAAVGNMVGGMIDGALMPAATQRVQGPRLASLDVALPAEGSPLPEVYGWARVSAKMVWRTRLKETPSTETSGGKGQPSQPKVQATTYRYHGNALFALCAGARGLHFGRVWADGRQVDAAKLGLRFYDGASDQAPDPFIAAVEGLEGAPAYRDTALMMVENLPLAPYGDRFPNFHVEVCRPVGAMEPLLRGLTMIPGNEWGLATTPIRQQVVDATGDVVSATVENSHRSEVETDFAVALRQACELCPNLNSLSLVLTWFGDDLRAGQCAIRPRVEIRTKKTSPLEWTAAGETRATAQLVSTVDGSPAFGSSPADASVREAIAAVRAAGKQVMIYPFVLMDIPAGNALPDPDGGASQPVYPWRGRIASEHDGTAQAAADVAAFFDGPAGYRRFILHLASLAVAAGGVDAFVIGTELRGLTQVRDHTGGYPAVAQLRRLAADVRAVLGPATKLGYAADWSEYFGHHPQDGSGDVRFHLDPLWADPAIDFVGIDNYVPISDWRDGEDHLDYDAAAGITTPYAFAHLNRGLGGGEGWEWFYASAADRRAQRRTPITDGAHGEPWVFRFKDIRSWWSMPHHERIGGVRSPTPTAWVPRSKPIWFTELGCPAVDKGANQPNVFVDPRSSESAAPYFSSGRRDDYMQRRFLEASLRWWADPANNPWSDVYGGRMVDVSRTHVWTADTRPWPEFPDLTGVWADGPNYRGGHWVRLGRAPLAETLRLRLAAEGLTDADLDLTQAHGQVDGFATDRALSFREWFTPWETALRVDAVETHGRLAFRSRVAASAWGVITPDDVAESGAASRFRLTRSAAEDPPRTALVRFSDSAADWQTGAARATLGVGVEDGVAEAAVALGMDLERADAIAAAWLRDVTEARETLEFTAPPSWTDLEPGRPFAFEIDGRRRPYMVDAVALGEGRKVTARSFDQAALRGGLTGPARPPVRVVTAAPAPPVVAFLDLPALSHDADPAAGYAAAHAEPWLGVELHRAADQAGPYELREALAARTPMGRLAAALAPADADRWVAGPAVVRLFAGELLTRSDAEVLGGANALAVEAAPGVWEVLQFARAELTGPRTYTLRGLLRGRLGTEAPAAAGSAEGARVVVLGPTLAQPRMTAADIGRSWWWRAAPAGRDPAGAFGVQRSHAFTGVGLRPLAPTFLQAARLPDGGAQATWLRRSRQPGQPWRTPPLGEEREAYRVRVRAAGGAGPVVREAEATASQWTYPAAARAADGLGARFRLEVAQLSAVVGPGAWAVADVTV
jgi:hypothetical protein